MGRKISFELLDIGITLVEQGVEIEAIPGLFFIPQIEIDPDQKLVGHQMGGVAAHHLFEYLQRRHLLPERQPESGVWDRPSSAGARRLTTSAAMYQAWWSEPVSRLWSLEPWIRADCTRISAFLLWNPKGRHIGPRSGATGTFL
jgi:hypothetical protein